MFFTSFHHEFTTKKVAASFQYFFFSMFTFFKDKRKTKIVFTLWFKKMALSSVFYKNAFYTLKSQKIKNLAILAVF